MNGVFPHVHQITRAPLVCTIMIVSLSFFFPFSLDWPTGEECEHASWSRRTRHRQGRRSAGTEAAHQLSLGCDARHRRWVVWFCTYACPRQPPLTIPPFLPLLFVVSPHAPIRSIQSDREVSPAPTLSEGPGHCWVSYHSAGDEGKGEGGESQSAAEV